MKVVLFCGGLGTRLREHSETIPKPMVPIGYRPLLWHLMKYYAHFGHREFILCLGYRGDVIKNYFLSYDECLSNDFTMTSGGKTLDLFSRDIQDWKITFIDTGLHVNIGQRLRAVRHLVEDDEIFMANYSDGLSNLDLNAYLEFFRAKGKTAALAAINPPQSFHVVRTDGDGSVSDIRHSGDAGFRINGGFFLFRRSIFDYIEKGEDLVEQPFRRLIARKELLAYRHDGFWRCMDTFKDKQAFDEMCASGVRPWEVWNHPARGGNG